MELQHIYNNQKRKPQLKYYCGCNQIHHVPQNKKHANEWKSNTGAICMLASFHFEPNYICKTELTLRYSGLAISLSCFSACRNTVPYVTQVLGVCRSAIFLHRIQDRIKTSSIKSLSIIAAIEHIRLKRSSLSSVFVARASVLKHAVLGRAHRLITCEPISAKPLCNCIAVFPSCVY